MLTTWKESYDQLRQHIEKQRHYFAKKCPDSQHHGFPVVMYGCESWTIKKAEHWRIDAMNCGVEEDSWESLGLQGDPTRHWSGIMFPNIIRWQIL